MYCFHCGNKLEGWEKFCPHCGGNLSKISNNKPEQTLPDNPAIKDDSPFESDAKEVFTSQLLLGGNPVRPDRIVIDHRNVLYEKRNRNLIGANRIIIPISRIASVEIDRKLISCRIIIYSKGSQDIVVENFSVSDGRKIKQAIEKRMY